MSAVMKILFIAAALAPAAATGQGLPHNGDMRAIDRLRAAGAVARANNQGSVLRNQTVVQDNRGVMPGPGRKAADCELGVVHLDPQAGRGLVAPNHETTTVVRNGTVVCSQ